MKYGVALLIGSSFIAGCATVAPISSSPYFQSNPSTVLLKHEGDISLNGTVSTGGESFLAAYAANSYLGLLASGSVAFPNAEYPNGNQFAGELGLGLFDTVSKGHIEHEIYGAAGWGTGHYSGATYLDDGFFDIQQISNDEQVRFWDAWVQAAAGYAGNNGSFMVLTRFSCVNIYHDLNRQTEWNGDSGFGGPGYDSFTTSRSSRLFFITPGFEASLGLEHIQIKASILEFIGISGVSSNSPELLKSVGICYKF